jgi:hypothetical protein
MRRLLAVVAFAVMIVPLLPADAAQAQRQQRTSSQQSRQTYVPAPAPPTGPPWAGPNQCWMDLGYGRWESCDR